MKNIIVDGQMFQTEGWYRGMGKYTVQVIQELSNHLPAGTKITIVFNSNLSKDTNRFEAIAYLCPHAEQILAPLPLPKKNKVKAKQYRVALEKLIADKFTNDDNYYLITSLFLFDFFAEFPANCHKLLLFYDLTPLLFWKYLGGYFPPHLYMKRFKRLYEAEHIFAISETTRKDLIATFGFDGSKITNINGGFTRIAKTTKKPTNFYLPEMFVLFPTGNLPHKNNEVAIRGFEQYLAENPRGLPMLITSNFSPKAQRRLLAMSKNIIFTGNVSEEELEWLFEHAQAIIFASKYEGLGMPILDAVASNKPIITSRISVFEEMSKDAFYYFDPYKPDELAESLTEALHHDNFKSKLKHYPQIMGKYTWANTCKTIVSAIDSLPRLNRAEPAIDNRKPIAVVSIHPGLNREVARVAEPLYGYLSKEFKVDYYFDANGYDHREMERPTYLDFVGCKVNDICKLTLRSYKQYDMVVYLVSATTLPSRAAQRAAVLPGIAVVEKGETKLNEQQSMFKELIERNQYTVLPFKSNITTEQLYIALSQAINDWIDKPNLTSKAIRQGRSNRSIIKKLTLDQAA
jgi:glycosyltransferase involved in cell wall biosynthesis